MDNEQSVLGPANNNTTTTEYPTVQPNPVEPSPAPTLVTPQAPTEPKKESTTKILAVIVVALLVISAIIALIVLLNNTPKNNPPVQKTEDDNNSAIFDKACGYLKDKPVYDELTKETAMEWVKKYYLGTDSACHIKNTLGDKAFVPPELARKKGSKFFWRLLWSYSDPSEISEIANSDYSLNKKEDDGIKVNFKIEQKNHYAIVYDETEESCEGSCAIGVTFDKEYLDYHERRSTDEEGHLTGVGYEERFTNTSEEWVKEALDVLRATTEAYGKSTFETEISSDGTDYLYTTRNASVGLDTERMYQQTYNSESSGVRPLVINLYYTQTKVNAQTGEITQVTGEDGKSKNFITKSFPLDDNESALMATAMWGYQSKP